MVRAHTAANATRKRVIVNGQLLNSVDSMAAREQPYGLGKASEPPALTDAPSSDRAATAGSMGGARVPMWRKTHGQRVDDKVGKLLESYRMIDQAILNDRTKRGESHLYQSNNQQQFPTRPLDGIAEELVARRHKYF